eukprot:TRINITY_DN61776_c0_g1_i1.p1 TRINITY_DN61776_c0_g1~~TRINITY_DN61776_c0_g1_i1.p1  ORF type:complete len:141 (+),score=8.82 TRINITY_DN61776_c0_g1_i1:183-605(+)
MTHLLLKTTKPKFLKSMRALSALFFTLAVGSASLTQHLSSTLPDLLSDASISAIYGNAIHRGTVMSASFLWASAIFLLMSLYKGEQRWTLLPHIFGLTIFISAGFWNGQFLIDSSKTLSVELTKRTTFIAPAHVPDWLDI